MRQRARNRAFASLLLSLPLSLSLSLSLSLLRRGIKNIPRAIERGARGRLNEGLRSFIHDRRRQRRVPRMPERIRSCRRRRAPLLAPSLVARFRVAREKARDAAMPTST